MGIGGVGESPLWGNISQTARKTMHIEDIGGNESRPRDAMLAAAVAGRNPKLLVVSGPSPNSLIPELGPSSSGLVHLQLN